MCARINRQVLRGLSLFDGHIVHLTHTDLDAVCCDALFKRKYGNVFTIFSSVQDYSSYLELLAQAEKTANLTLCLSDLGGRTSALEVVARLKNKGWRIEWRDHHVWDERFFEDIKNVVDYLRVDRELCACEIVCTDLLDGDLIAKEIAAIGRDRDFWINNDPRSEVLSTAISDDKSRGGDSTKTIAAGLLPTPRSKQCIRFKSVGRAKPSAKRSKSRFCSVVPSGHDQQRLHK